MKEIAGITIPDSDMAQRATRLVKELSPPFLYHHCLRTYLFGAALAQRDGFTYDHELFYVSAILHDLGLTERFDGPQRFEVQGADAARAFVKEQQWPEDKAELVWEAIALHTSIGIADRMQPEIALVHLGAGVDLFGLRFDEIPPAVVEQTLATCPRLGFKHAMAQALLSQVQRKPQSAAFTWMAEFGRSYLPEFVGLDWKTMIQRSPFHE
jgi:hypothetical protein